MIFGLYAVKDEAVSFGAVMTQNNDASAMRAFAHECENVDSYWHSHPSDYSLWKVGEYDSDTGQIIDTATNLVCRATDFVRKGDK